MSKLKNKKHLSTFLIIFALMLVTGIVYAIGAGQLIFSGDVTLHPIIEPPPVELKIVPANDTSTSPNGSSGTMTVASDGKSADITIEFTGPGEALTFSFRVENTGDAAAVILEPIITTNDYDSIISISGDYVDLEGMQIDVGETVPLTPVDIIITSSTDTYAPGSYTFSIELSYDQDI